MDAARSNEMEGPRGRPEEGERESNKISFTRNRPMSHVQKPKQKSMKESDEEY
jgi:hypothetical protein